MTNWTFNTAVEWEGGDALTLKSPGLPDLPMSAPVDLGGEPGKWTPEDLLVGALESCILLTTLFFVNKMKIDLKKYSSKASGDLSRTPEGLRFQKYEVDISVELSSEADEEKIRKAVAQAEEFCLVSAGLKAPVRVNLHTSVTT